MEDLKLKFLETKVEEVYSKTTAEIREMDIEALEFLIEQNDELYEDFLSRKTEIKQIIKNGKEEALKFLETEEAEGYKNIYIEFFIRNYFKLENKDKAIKQSNKEDAIKEAKERKGI